MKNWVVTKLEKVADFYNGGAWSPDEYVDSGIPVVRVSDISNGTINLDNCKYLSSNSLHKYKKHTLFTGDLVIATVGSHPTQPGSVVGRPAIVPANVHGALLNQNAVRITPSSDLLDKIYLGYLGKSQFFRDYIIQCARGSANQVRMSIGLLKEMQIALPPLFTQKKIASILSAYDDLIENNIRRIKILEEMAQTLYHEWFIKFRFPGHEQVNMVESELGLIPEGWEVKKLGDIAQEVRRGISPDTIDPETPYFGLEHLPRKSIALSEWGKAAEVQSTKLVFYKKEILFGKIRPYFHKVGVAPFDGICSSDTIVINPKIPQYFSIVLSCVSSEDFVNHATQTSQGTKMPRANWDILTKYPIIIPPSYILEQFNKFIENAVQQIQILILKNKNLQKTRDLLLPKLISGEIDVENLNIDTLDIAA